jgi:hypothetical protein
MRRLPHAVRLVAGVAAVLLVAVILRLAGDETTQPEVVAPKASTTQPPSAEVGMPVAAAGDGWTCPVGLPYAAYAGFHFFPPNHPGRPEFTVKPQACFATGPDARAAGYSEAIVLGSRTAEGVYLVPLPDGPEDRCRFAADSLGFAVPCPTLLPNLTYGRIPSTCSGAVDGTSGETCVWHGSAFLYEEGAFDVPPGYHPPHARNVPHLFVAAWTATSRLGVPSSLFQASLSCPGATRTASLDIALAGVPSMASAEVLACGQGNNPAFAHTLVRWRSGGVTYEVGVLGFTPTSLHLATAVISALVFVEPTALGS